MFRAALLLLFAGCFVDIPVGHATAGTPLYLVGIDKLNKTSTGAKKYVHLCDGALLDYRYILTSANCIQGESRKTLSIIDDRPDSYRRRVYKIYYLKDFDHRPCRQHQHDIAILKINDMFDLEDDETYKRVYLPEPQSEYDRTKATLSGILRNKVNTLDATVISNEECMQQSASVITKGTMCARISKTLAAKMNFNTGAPLVVDRTVIGIMNAPVNICDPSNVASLNSVKQPSNLILFTRVSEYLDFIEKVIESQPSLAIAEN